MLRTPFVMLFLHMQCVWGSGPRARAGACARARARAPAPERAMAAQRWEVVGGAEKGGILVRDGRSTASQESGEGQPQPLTHPFGMSNDPLPT